MLVEFSAGRKTVYRVSPQHGGNVEPVSEVYAVDHFKGLDGDVAQPPVAPNRPRGDGHGIRSDASSSQHLRRRVQSTLERVFLPAGYPNSVTDDLLEFALWDVAQVLASSVMSALSVRAVLLGVGVGESSADLMSSTLSWMMRDGTWLIGSILFASFISPMLEYRAKSWRLIADFTNDTAAFLELCAPLLPGGQLTFRLVVVMASVIKALVGVCGGGTRASLTQHFALRSNTADVTAKAGMRSNVGSLIGLSLGIIVAYIVPASSVTLTLSVFVLTTSFHLYANFRAIRAVQLQHLNAPRLEWCCERFCLFRERALVAQKKDNGARAAGAPVLDISVWRANAEEPLFILPALPVAPPGNVGLSEKAYCLFCKYLCPLTLRLRLHCAASLSQVLAAQAHLTVAGKQQLMSCVAESLSIRGIALLFDEETQSYYTILPEFHTAGGVPESWVRYKRQYDAEQREKAQRRQLKSGTTVRDEEKASAEVDEAAEQMERLRKERVVVPSHVLPLAYRELWAFFYAYMHYRAVCERHARGQLHANAVLPTRRNDADGAASPARPTLHLIAHLRADGMLEEAPHGEDHDAKIAAATSTVVDLNSFEAMTSPTFTLSSKSGDFPRKAGGGATADTSAKATASIVPQDGLYPLYIEFVRELRKTGWALDRLLVGNEGYTTVVQYV